MRHLYIWTCISITVFGAATGDVLVALAMRRIGDLVEFRQRHGLIATVVRVLSSGVLFSGIFFMAIAFFSNLVGLTWADLSLIGPASAALTFAASTLAAKFFLREDVDRRRWTAAIFVCCGVLLLART